MNLSENTAEAVAELMDDAAAILDAAGFSIDESVTEPQDFIEAVADLLDENDLDEDSEENLCLGLALIEAFMGGFDIELNEEELAEGELPEASMLARLNKSARRAIEKESPLGSWKGAPKDKLANKWAQHQDFKAKAGEDALRKARQGVSKADKKAGKLKVRNAEIAAHQRAAQDAGGKPPSWSQARAEVAKKTASADPLLNREASAILRKLMDKRATLRKASAGVQALRRKDGTKAAQPKRTRFPKASSESVESPDEDIRAILAVVEAAGYEVPDDLSVVDFMEAVEALAAEDAVIAEGVGARLAVIGLRALGSKTAARAAKKVTKAGADWAVKKLKGNTETPAAESIEDADELLATMIEVVTNNGYEFEGASEALDPNKFLDAAVKIAETDEDLGEDISAWLKKSAEAIRSMGEGSQTGKLPARGSAANRKFVKKATSKKARAAAKKDPENAPSRRTSGWAD